MMHVKGKWLALELSAISIKNLYVISNSYNIIFGFFKSSRNYAFINYFLPRLGWAKTELI